MFFLPMLNTKINVVNVLQATACHSVASLEKRSDAYIRNMLKKARKHGFSVAVLSSTMSTKQTADAFRDCMYRGDWSASTYKLKQDVGSVQQSSRLLAICQELGFGYVTKDGGLVLSFYNAAADVVESVGSAVISLCVNEAVDSFVTRPIFSQSAQVRHAARIQLQSDIEGAIESTKTPGVNAESVGVETAIEGNAITVTVTTSEGTRTYVYAIDRTKLTATCPILEKYVGVFSPFNYPLKIVGA